eukprot:g2024.t1
MDDASIHASEKERSRSASLEHQDFSFLYDDVSNDSFFDGLEDSYESESSMAGNSVPLSTPFFDVGTSIEVAKFNRFRKNYRSFRKGTPKGAKGEIYQCVKETTDKNSRPFSAVPPFLEKLYDMLSEQSLRNYISWCDDGTTIFVKKVDEFSKLVLPRYFKHDKFASFLRQLNMYNFYTTRQEPNMRQFSNPLFRRNAKDSIRNIKRKRGTSKKTSTKSGKAMPSSGMDKHSNPDGGYSNTFSGKQKKNIKRQRMSKAHEDKLQAKQTTPTSGRLQSNGSRGNSNSSVVLKARPAQAVSGRESDSRNYLNVQTGIVDVAVDGHSEYNEKGYGLHTSMKVRTLKNQNLNAHYEENGVPTKELYQIKQNLASTIEANKKLNDEVIALRKEMSRNRNQIKSQEKVIKVLEGNLKSIIARYSTMNEKLTLLQEELGNKT